MRQFGRCPMVITPDYITGESSPFCQQEAEPEFHELGAVSGDSNSMCMKVLYLQSKKTKSKCPIVDRQYFGICVWRNYTEDGLKFSFGGQIYTCPKEGGEKEIEVDSTTSPNGCKVSAKFCCPSYNVCSAPYNNNTIMKLGRCSC